ncbi:MAG: ABC transporter permease [Alphaproteobacteria bacterium]|nr:ABC transporter permease [Alphaproteobacteria bacterium]
MDDLFGGFRRYWMWGSLALQDMKLRYRGSIIGPFWVTISTLVMIVAMGFIYPHLFHSPPISYIPYLGLGLIVWQLISSLITEGCASFTAADSIIQQVPIPFSIHVYRVVCRNFMVFAHNLLLVPLGIVAFGITLHWNLIEALAGCAVLALNGVAVGLLLGILSTRFRDIAPIVASFLQVAFFVTPIFWPIEALGGYRPIGELNPLFCAIDVIRAPLLGVPITSSSWPVLLGTTAVACAFAFAMFARFRSRIAYWI